MRYLLEERAKIDTYHGDIMNPLLALLGRSFRVTGRTVSSRRSETSLVSKHAWQGSWRVWWLV